MRGVSTNKGGRSNSFFFFTQDRKYIVKTLTSYELGVLLGILESLAEHMKNQLRKGIEPLLAKIQGVYQFNLSQSSFINVIIMTNSSLLQDDSNYICNRFDLKGSMISRRTLPRQMADVNLQNHGESTVMKDQDLKFLTHYIN